jgi:TrbB_P: P-type conjugative transfer ATPase TrbB
LKELLKQRVMEKLNFSQEISDEHLKGVIQEEIMKISEEYPLLLSDKIRLNQEVFYALRRLDILQDLLEDDSVTEIMINGYKNIFIERQGKLHRYPGHFSDNEKLYQVIQQVASGANRMVNERNPIVDARLNDGSRVNIILPPISIDGATMTIRKFAKEPMTLAWLCEREAFSEEIAKFLKILVRARYNIFISGGTGSGKTTLLNGMSNCIPKDERIITIEDSAELKLNGIDNLVRLEMRNANAAGENQVDMKELIKAALRSRPDRIIVGEVRGEEALSMLNAMNTGHDGSISTGHANSCKDMLKRIETMVLMGVDMPVEAIRGQMASAIDVIIHLGRSFDGSRKLMEISEITGMAASQVALHPLFEMNEDDELTMRSELCDQKKLKGMVSMKHIRNLWNLLKQEISLWKYEKQELVKGICYIVMIAWLFFDRIAFAILLIPYLFVFMKQQRIHKVHREKEKLRKEFREMMISIGNSLSAGYSIENALKTAKK